MFTSGNRVKVAGYLSKTEQRDFLATNMLFGGGKEILTMPNVDPYWTDDRLGAQDAWQSDDERLAQTEPSQGGIFQVWSIPRSGGRTSTLPFRQSAIAARANWDMVDNPMTRCEQPGMPRIMANPHPFEFIDTGDHIVFLGEEFDMVRTLYLDAATSAGAAIPSNMGYSVAHWEDGTLVIHTSKINWPYFDGIGTPQSDAVEVVEHYTLSEDQRRLDYVITTTDPSILTGPAIYEGYWLALGEKVEPFDCEQF
jgi:hypothetical protein